ncbi:site-specific integrase [Natrinema marinum]|uniref:site-specific integrase n=1 Tax=Natrinema marinum TaxID=2961598 RepID=UPI0020C86A00|nr:site-specific integrase [Natrinema marinum]
MARSYSQQYEDTRERVREHRHGGEFEITNGRTKEFPAYEDPEDAERMLQMADAYDEENLVEDTPDGQKTKSETTLKNYLSGLKKTAPHVALTDTSATELNTVMQGFHDGTLENVKDDGLSKGTIRIYQNALRQFYYVFSDVSVASEDITLFQIDDKAVDPADMLTREEIQAMRDAADCMRDRALFDFLIYTGQRNTATRTLRIKDLELENDRFRLNGDATGLKEAEKNGKWRDLLLSSATLKQYLSTEHPAPDDPEAYVFVGRPKYAGPDPKTMLDPTTIGAIVGRLSERAAEDYPAIESKPTHPHALRHNFVTIALRRGMDESAIKHQIGHKHESTVMESTYAHLKDSDHIREAREAFDLEVDEAESELTPEVCPRCGENPPADARLCPYCGLEYTPDAEKMMERANEDVRNSYQQVDADDAETVEKLQIVDELLDDPEVKKALLEKSESA